jgi:hypothetical protein
MMKTGYKITDYCLIRNQQVYLGDQLVFSASESKGTEFLVDLYRHFKMNYPKFHKMDSLCKLGFLCSEILLSGKGIGEKYRGEDVGLVFWNAASSIDSDRNHQQTISDRAAYFPSPSIFVYTLANIVIGEICIRQKFYGESEFFIAKKFDPVVLHDYVKQLLDENVMECCLTGWIESDGDQCEGLLYLIEKSPSDTSGIAIFEPEKLERIYLQEN